MKKRDLIVLVVVALSFGLSADCGFTATENEGSSQLPASKAISPKVGASKAVAVKTASSKVVAPKAVASGASTRAAEMTKGEMIAEIKEDLANTNEIFDIVPELKSTIGHQDGKAVYTFNGAALESLSKEDLTSLFNRVRNAIVKIRTDRIQKQLEITKQAQRIRVITSPRQSPHVPSATPSVPKVPSLPPSASQRR